MTPTAGLTVPLWLEYVKAFGTPVVAILAACITATFAYRQWRTAHEKVVLDLFDRRFALYVELRSIAVKIFINDPHGVTDEDIKKFEEMLDKSQFLFGVEVHRYVSDAFESLKKARSLRQKYENAKDDRKKAIFDEQFKHLIKIEDLIDNLNRLVFPYMKLDQKLTGKVVRRPVT